MKGETFLMVYSITDKNSFTELRRYHDMVVEIKDSDNIPMILIGNKCDLESERVIAMCEGVEVAKTWNCKFMETSAKSRINIEECFIDLVRQIRQFKGTVVQSTPKKRTCVLF